MLVTMTKFGGDGDFHFEDHRHHHRQFCTSCVCWVVRVDGDDEGNY